MIYLIFTAEGFEQAKQDILEDKAELWISDEVLTKDDQALLAAKQIKVSILPMQVEPTQEKSVMTALDFVEKNTSDAEILVEFV